MFPYIAKYNESEYDIQNNDLLCTKNTTIFSIFWKMFENIKTTQKKNKCSFCNQYSFHNSYFVVFEIFVIFGFWVFVYFYIFYITRVGPFTRVCPFTHVDAQTIEISH